jgi:hypothetical protein
MGLAQRGRVNRPANEHRLCSRHRYVSRFSTPTPLQVKLMLVRSARRFSYARVWCEDSAPLLVPVNFLRVAQGPERAKSLCGKTSCLESQRTEGKPNERRELQGTDPGDRRQGGRAEDAH